MSRPHHHVFHVFAGWKAYDQHPAQDLEGDLRDKRRFRARGHLHQMDIHVENPGMLFRRRMLKTLFQHLLYRCSENRLARVRFEQPPGINIHHCVRKQHNKTKVLFIIFGTNSPYHISIGSVGSIKIKSLHITIRWKAMLSGIEKTLL